MLPALCFVFSRKMLEDCAKELTTNLLEFDSKVPYIIQRECEQIIRKLPNYQEYLLLPEYNNMVSLLQKGIAVHHAGIMPVLREMVELLYAKGLVKFLFATETFAVGINMPTKTVIFSSLEKWDGNNIRMLRSHEYIQMAGRAGRRGIDDIGHVIHLNNLYKNIDNVNYKLMMNGQPQKLISKFRISYNLILSLIGAETQSFVDFIKRSMIQNDLTNETEKYFYKMNELRNNMDIIREKMHYFKTPTFILQDYVNLLKARVTTVNSKRKELDKMIKNIEHDYVFAHSEKDILLQYNELNNELLIVEKEINLKEQFIHNNVESVLDILNENEFIIKDVEENKYKLSIKGSIANQIREVHCLVLAEIILNGKFKSLNVEELVGIFSCFTNISVIEDYRDVLPSDYNKNVQCLIYDIMKQYDNYLNKEACKKINTGTECILQFDIIKYSIDWCKCETVDECKLVLQDMLNNKQIFLGEFIKALLKINNISSEMEKIAEFMGDMELLQVLKDIPIKLLKYVATNQSLYI
jgi:superfamily II RNA helicase